MHVFLQIKLVILHLQAKKICNPYFLIAFLKVIVIIDLSIKSHKLWQYLHTSQVFRKKKKKKRIITRMATSFFSFLAITALGLSLLFIGSNVDQLSAIYYASSCPNLFRTIKSIVEATISKEARMGASILRLFYHDCFVNVSFQFFKYCTLKLSSKVLIIF